MIYTVRPMEKQDDIVLEDVLELHPLMWIIIGHFNLYADVHGLPKKLTSLKNDRENVQSVSKTHEDGRAADYSAEGWPQVHIVGVQKYINEKCGDIGAFSASDYKQRPIIFHNYKGQGDHFHLQSHR